MKAETKIRKAKIHALTERYVIARLNGRGTKGVEKQILRLKAEGKKTKRK